MERMMSETRLQNNLTDALHQLTQLMPGGVFCYDVDENEEFLFISESMPGMFGYTMEEFRTKFHNRFPDMVYKEDRKRVQHEIQEQMKKGNSDFCMYRVEMPDGALKWVYDRGRMITDKNGKRWFYVVIVDADDLKVAEQRKKEHEEQVLKELRSQAEHDMMTGLLNRYTAVLSIKKAIQKYFAGTLFVLDIDNFKEVNDTKGYHFGDQILKDIAVALRRLVHPEEILARFGGDKFIVFIPGNYNRKRAEKRAEEIITVVREAMDIDDGGCSIGITISESEETTFEEMLLRAEKALYEAKNTGKGKYYLACEE